MATAETKMCHRCRLIKPCLDFARDAGAPDGKFRWCRACCREHRRKYNEVNKHLISERRKQKRKDDPEQARQRDKRNYERAKATGRINRQKANETNRRYMAKPEVRAKRAEAERLRRARHKEKYEDQWRRRNKKVAADLGDTYILRLIVRKGATCGRYMGLDELIQLKREQISLHRLAKELKQAIDERN
jgi:hypothetical protein